MFDWDEFVKRSCFHYIFKVTFHLKTAINSCVFGKEKNKWILKITSLVSRPSALCNIPVHPAAETVHWPEFSKKICWPKVGSRRDAGSYSDRFSASIDQDGVHPFSREGAWFDFFLILCLNTSIRYYTHWYVLTNLFVNTSRDTKWRKVIWWRQKRGVFKPRLKYRHSATITTNSRVCSGVWRIQTILWLMQTINWPTAGMERLAQKYVYLKHAKK